MFTVCANELALTKAHIRLEGEWYAGPGCRVGSRAAAADMRQSHEAFKIRDLRRIAKVGQRKGGIERIVVDENCERRERRHAPGDRVRLALVVLISTGGRWTQETSPRQSAHSRHSLEERTSRPPGR